MSFPEGFALRNKIILISIAFIFFLAMNTPLAPIPETENVPLLIANHPFCGTSAKLDVYEFAQNQSQIYTDIHNESTFSYLSDWFPSDFRGYKLQGKITELRKTVNPLPNGDFEQYPEPDNNWTLTDGGFYLNNYLVNSISNTSGGNPGSCLDVELAYAKLLSKRTAKIENQFMYRSAVTPDSLSLSFDISFSEDITKANWLIVNIAIIDEFDVTIGSWIRDTLSYSPSTWESHNFLTSPINGSLTLRITIQKTIDTNVEVDGHIYFDNFEYQIGSYTNPSEVGLTLNGTTVIDTVEREGEVSIYADPILKEEINLNDAWTSSLFFTITSSDSITFHFQYTMYVKSERLEAAQPAFTVYPDAEPTWITNYTISSERPPPGYNNYQFGLYLPEGWTSPLLKNQIGNTITTFSFNSTSGFLLTDESIGTTGDSFTIHSTSSNYISSISAQKSSSYHGPWTNISLTGYVVAGEFIRVQAKLQSIESTGNWGNVSIFLANGTFWNCDSSPIFNSLNNTLTSTAWEVKSIGDTIAGASSLIIVHYNSSHDAGHKTRSLTFMNRAQAMLNWPISNNKYGWYPLPINVSWYDFDSEHFIPDANSRLRFTDRLNQVQYINMIPNGQGSYTVLFPTSSFDSETQISFDIEFEKQGYVNATFNQGTAYNFIVTINSGLHPQIQLTVSLVILISLFTILLVTSWALYTKVYRQRYLLPKQREHEEKLHDILDIFNDVTNLSRFLVLNRGSGIAIFDPFKARGMDASIIGGFLQAIQAFAIDVADGTEDQELKNQTRLSEITYEGFRVILNDGQIIRTALVYKGTPSENLKEKINLFTTRFEQRYQQDLAKRGHEPRVFEGATDLLEEIFHVSLLFPHKVEAQTDFTNLSYLESRLHYVALELTKERNLVYLSEIVNSYLETVQENPLELLNAIFQLREKKLLIPTEFLSFLNSS